MAPTPSGNGYWLTSADGGVFTFGDAQFRDSLADIALQQPIVGIASHSTNAGYWLVGKDGAVYAFGNAAYKGGTNGEAPPERVTHVGIASYRSGRGYTVVSWDPEGKVGRVRRFGDAPFFGNPAGMIG
jgi:hypothetical protein